VYDVRARCARRVLEGDRSVSAERVDTTVEGKTLKLLFIPIRVAVDSIVLDLANEYLYYGPLSGTHLYRIPAAALRDAALSPKELAARVEDYGPKPISDGITIDRDDNVYLTAIEEHAVTVLRPPGATRRRNGDRGGPGSGEAHAERG